MPLAPRWWKPDRFGERYAVKSGLRSAFFVWGGVNLKIVQLSDCHVSAAPNAVYRGIDPRQTLRSLLPAVQAWAPDLVLLTGDLAEEPSAETYAWLRAKLDPLGVPLLTLPGNHDDPALQTRAFPATALEQPLSELRGGWEIVLLNSAAPGRISGVLSEATLNGLEAELGGRSLPALVVLHHQPVPTGSRWIDRYPLEQPERFWTVIDRHPRVRAVCWGHIHHDFRAWRGSVALLGAPSTARNSLPGSSSFAADEAGPACRWLLLGSDGSLETGLLRPAGSAFGQNQPENQVHQDAGEGGG
jgi:Icc protein